MSDKCFYREYCVLLFIELGKKNIDLSLFSPKVTFSDDTVFSPPHGFLSAGSFSLLTKI